MAHPSHGQGESPHLNSGQAVPVSWGHQYGIPASQHDGSFPQWMTPNYFVPPPPWPFAAAATQQMPAWNPIPSQAGQLKDTPALDTQMPQSDASWIKEWLKKMNKFPGRDSQRPAEKSILVCEAKEQLREAFRLLKQLSDIKSNLEASIEAKEDVWKCEMKKLQPVQESLVKIMNVFSQEQLVNQVKKKMAKIQKKRARMKRLRAEAEQKVLEREKARLEFEKDIQSWKEQIREKLLQDKMDKQMKAEADSILAEVRRKLSEAKKAKERLRLLEKLRAIRKDAVQRKGLHPSLESDQEFTSKVSLLRSVVQSQLFTYEAEEKALQVMLETEHEGQKEQQQARKHQEMQALVQAREADAIQGLFGSIDAPDERDPMYFFWQYYTQGERSLECLLHIRHGWDVCLVPVSDPTGSSIPPKWVVPIEPSSDGWASTLVTTEQTAT